MGRMGKGKEQKRQTRDKRFVVCSVRYIVHMAVVVAVVVVALIRRICRMRRQH